MAGGMSSRDRAPTLAERSGLTAQEKAPSRPAHCWVAGPTARYPGLLLEWRRRDGRWQGLVTYLQVADSGAYSLVQCWLDSDRLHAAASRG